MGEKRDAATVLIGIYKDQVAVVNSLWNIFQIVALALLGFLYKLDSGDRSLPVITALSIGFLIFAFGNQQAMMRSQDIVFSAAAALTSPALVAGVDQELRATLAAHRAPPSRRLRIGHTVFAGLVVLALWVPVIAKCRC